MDAPRVEELADHPRVKLALDKCWRDSLSEDPVLRHEEGGWIDMNTQKDIRIIHAGRGVQAAIDLTEPPIIDGYFIVGKFHSHPNPTSEGWNPGPSKADIRIDSQHGVPDLIVADDGVYYSGPTHRRGGLSGSFGFPGEGLT